MFSHGTRQRISDCVSRIFARKYEPIDGPSLRSCSIYIMLLFIPTDWLHSVAWLWNTPRSKMLRLRSMANCLTLYRIYLWRHVSSQMSAYIRLDCCSICNPIAYFLQRACSHPIERCSCEDPMVECQIYRDGVWYTGNSRGSRSVSNLAADFVGPSGNANVERRVACKGAFRCVRQFFEPTSSIPVASIQTPQQGFQQPPDRPKWRLME